MRKICVRVVSNTKAILKGGSSVLWRRLYEKLSFEYPNACFRTQVIRYAGYVVKIRGLPLAEAMRMAVRKVGTRHLFSVLTGAFPLGLLDRVLDLLHRSKVTYEVEIRDERPSVRLCPSPEAVRPDLLQGITLHDHQVGACRAALVAQRGILKLATNAGKTECAAAIIKVLPSRYSILFIVHTKKLLRQARVRFAERLGVVEDAIGEVGDGIFFPKRITVAIVNSLYKRLKDPQVKKWLRDDVDVLFLDECHHQRAGTFYPTSQACNAQFRIGLSATPWDNEADRLLVEAVCGPVLYETDNEEMIGLGLSAKPTVEILRYRTTSFDDDWEWPRIYREGVVENADRNAAIVARIEALVHDGTLTMVLVSQVWHGEILSSLLRVLGIKHEFVHAKLSGTEIDEAQDRFSRREFYVLIASPIFGEGVDIPAIGALVIADGGKSLKSVLQKVGRALRKKKEGENVVTIVDLADKGHRLLAKHSRRRITIYEREKFEVVAA